MSDLIDRQEAIDAINKMRFAHWFECGEYIGECQRRREIVNANKAVDKIEKLPSAQPEQKWIPCSERLPFAEYGEGDRVYCCCLDEKRGGKWAEILYFNGGVWCRPTGETFDYKVLAWYPLPTKPYRAERRES